MTKEDYLMQGICLDRRIRYRLQRIEDLRADARSIPPPLLRADRVQTSPPGEARYVRALERAEEMQEQVSRELEELYALKAQIEEVICGVENEKYRLVLSYRYLQGLNWQEIADRLYADRRTVRRWHGAALEMVVLPEEPLCCRGI